MQTHESSSLKLHPGRSEEDKPQQQPPSAPTSSHGTDVATGEWQEALSEEGYVYYWNSETGGCVFSLHNETLMILHDFYEHMKCYGSVLMIYDAWGIVWMLFIYLAIIDVVILVIYLALCPEKHDNLFH